MGKEVQDPNGAAERPSCGSMQAVADRLREVANSEPDPERRAAMIAGADGLELQLDWLLEQHRIITELKA